jgi:hypothetical protein
MSILGKIRSLIASAVADEKELATYRQLNIAKRNQWYRVVDHLGKVVGAQFICVCGISYRFLAITDHVKTHRCKACRHEFCLATELGSDWILRLAALPTAAGAPVGQTQVPRFHDTWANDSGETVQWDGGSMTGYRG